MKFIVNIFARFFVMGLIIGGLLLWYYDDNGIVDVNTVTQQKSTPLKTNEIREQHKEQRLTREIRTLKEKNDEKETFEIEMFEESSSPVKTLPEYVLQENIPFVVQAPSAQWSDERFQDACEEASLLMAHAWLAKGQRFTKKEATKELEALFITSGNLFGEHVIDTSAVDTAKLFAAHYKKKAFLKKDITTDDLYTILANGGIIIAPTNGRELGNKYFTNGGPERHMLVIIGYDYAKKEFIVHDPGTKRGKGYRYKESTLYNAIRDYETGTKETIGAVRRTVLVIQK